MDRPPQSPHLPIFSRALLYRTAIWGAIISALSLGAFLWSLHDRPDDGIRASMLCFQVLVLAQLANLTNAGGLSTAALRDLVRSPYTFGAIIIVVGLQIAASHFSPLASVLDLRPLTSQDWLMVVSLAVMPAVLGQSVARIKAARGTTVSAAR